MLSDRKRAGRERSRVLARATQGARAEGDAVAVEGHRSRRVGHGIRARTVDRHRCPEGDPLARDRRVDARQQGGAGAGAVDGLGQDGQFEHGPVTGDAAPKSDAEEIAAAVFNQAGVGVCSVGAIERSQGGDGAAAGAAPRTRSRRWPPRPQKWCRRNYRYRPQPGRRGGLLR